MNDKNKVVFITGGNRGIGYGLALQMLKKNYIVLAGYRDENRSKLLIDTARKMKNLFPVKVNTTTENDLNSLHDFISDQFGYLDILVNNAGVNIQDSANFFEVEWHDIAENFRINVGGPFLTTKYLYPLLKNGRDKKIVNANSEMGSIQLSSGDATPYRISKAALNMLTKNQSIEFKADGITVISLNPGWVKTNMGGKYAPLTVEESANKIARLIDTLSINDTGKFMSFDGKSLPY